MARAWFLAAILLIGLPWPFHRHQRAKKRAAAVAKTWREEYSDDCFYSRRQSGQDRERCRLRKAGRI